MNRRYPNKPNIAATPLAATLLLVLAVTVPLEAQQGTRPGQAAQQDTTGQGGAPPLKQLIQEAKLESDMRLVTRRFNQDRSNIRYRYDVPYSPVRIQRERRLINGYIQRLNALEVDDLNEAGRTEHTEFRQHLDDQLLALQEQERHAEEWAPLLPFARPIQLLQERRRDRLDVDPRKAAQTVEDVRKEVLRLTALVPGASRPDGAEELRSITPEIAGRAVEHMERLETNLNSWHSFYYGFDPEFTWWVRTPYQELTEAMEAYVAAIQEEWPED